MSGSGIGVRAGVAGVRVCGGEGKTPATTGGGVCGRFFNQGRAWGDYGRDAIRSRVFLRFVTVDTFDTFSRRGLRLAGGVWFACRTGRFRGGRKAKAGGESASLPRVVYRRGVWLAGVAVVAVVAVSGGFWRFLAGSPCLPGVWRRCCVRLRWHDWCTQP